MRFHNVVPVQERHLAIRFYPHLQRKPVRQLLMKGPKLPDLVFRVLRKVVEAGDVQLEFAAFAEFSKACAKADEVGPSNGNCKFHGRFGDIEDAISVQAKAVGFIWSVYQVDNVLSLFYSLVTTYKLESWLTYDVVCEFSKYELALIFCQRPHPRRDWLKSNYESWLHVNLCASK